MPQQQYTYSGSRKTASSLSSMRTRLQTAKKRQGMAQTAVSRMRKPATAAEMKNRMQGKPAASSLTQNQTAELRKRRQMMMEKKIASQKS